MNFKWVSLENRDSLEGPGQQWSRQPVLRGSDSGKESLLRARESASLLGIVCSTSCQTGHGEGVTGLGVRRLSSLLPSLCLYNWMTLSALDELWSLSLMMKVRMMEMIRRTVMMVVLVLVVMTVTISWGSMYSIPGPMLRAVHIIISKYGRYYF